MALTARTAASDRAVALALASGLPLLCYIATASGHGYWHDAGEFVAASTELGISHPPGHPLAALVGSAATLLPLGPLAFRVALASAALAAVASGVFYLAIERTVRAMGVVAPSISVPLALGGAWLVAGSNGFWLQAVRPEVYALAAALVAIVIERAVALEAAWPTRDVRPIYAASLALGLALANHHFLALLVLPAIAPTLARVYRVRGMRSLALALGFLALGLATYVYLPIRATATRGSALGDPSSIDRFFWVVSAEAFQKNAVGVVQPLGERMADVVVQAVDSLHVVPVLLVLAGFYAVLRAPGARRIGVLWVAVVLVFGLARGWLGFVRGNPDALGYMLPMLSAMGALAAAFVAAALVAIGKADRERPRRTAILLALVAAALGAAQLHATLDRASLAEFSATDAFEELGRRRLPERAVVIAHNPQTIFRFWGGQAEDGARPDVTLVPMPLLSYPGLVDRLVDADPELRDLLQEALLEGEIGEAGISSLAAQRPVLVELDPHVAPELYGTLVPAPLFHRALAGRAYEEDREAGAVAQAAGIDELVALLGADVEEYETRRQLVWGLYLDALYFAGSGDHERAAVVADRALALSPLARELRAFRAALVPEGTEPLDVRPFFP